jgi:transcriptional regulator GlxA family with amidase domain
MPPLLVQIILFDGFDLLDAIAPYEVLVAGSMASGNALDVRFVSLEGARPVPSGPTGVPIPATGSLDIDRASIIVLPGAAGKVEGDGPDTIPALLGRAIETGLVEHLRLALDCDEIMIATVCGGSLVLALAGLLGDRFAVTHHMGMEILGATGAKPIQARVVEDGRLISGAGVTSGLDVGFHLLEKLLGPRVAHHVERLFEYERRGTVWRSEGIVPAAA